MEVHNAECTISTDKSRLQFDIIQKFLAEPSPELLDELRLLAAKYPRAATSGFRSRVRRVLGHFKVVPFGLERE
ncbi:MAG: hypothetical protein ABI878_04255 [Acidobacteriota bacterium]